MARARHRHTWNHTASILSMLFNVNRGRTPPRSPLDFMPPAFSAPEPELTVAEMGAHLKASGFRSSRVQQPAFSPPA